MPISTVEDEDQMNRDLLYWYGTAPIEAEAGIDPFGDDYGLDQGFWTRDLDDELLESIKNNYATLQAYKQPDGTYVANDPNDLDAVLGLMRVDIRKASSFCLYLKCQYYIQFNLLVHDAPLRTQLGVAYDMDENPFFRFPEKLNRAVGLMQDASDANTWQVPNDNGPYMGENAIILADESRAIVTFLEPLVVGCFKPAVNFPVGCWAGRSDLLPRVKDFNITMNFEKDLAKRLFYVEWRRRLDQYPCLTLTPLDAELITFHCKEELAVPRLFPLTRVETKLLSTLTFEDSTESQTKLSSRIEFRGSPKYIMLHSQRVWETVHTMTNPTLDKTLSLSDISLHLNETSFAMCIPAPELWTSAVSREYIPSVDDNRCVVCLPLTWIPQTTALREFSDLRITYTATENNYDILSAADSGFENEGNLGLV